MWNGGDMKGIDPVRVLRRQCPDACLKWIIVDGLGCAYHGAYHVCTADQKHNGDCMCTCDKVIATRTEET